jgi:hypothetical protein
MTSSKENGHWIVKIAGSLFIFVAAFLLLHFWSLWELGIVLSVTVAAALAVLFLVFGGSVWRWIAEISNWSCTYE